MNPAQTIVIRSAADTDYSMLSNLREFWKYRSLLRVLVLRQLRLRYKNSALGFAWSLIIPLVQVCVLTVAIGYILQSGPSNLSAYILCAYLPWTFFQSSVLDASSSVLGYQDILRKVYFPREILPVVSVLANAVQLGSAMVVFVVYRWGILWLLHGWPGWPPLEVLWLPVVALMLISLATGISFYFAIWANFYEDVKYLLTTFLGMLLYLLPIIYFPENIFYTQRIHSPHLRSVLYHIYLCNPLAWIVTAFKQMFFPPQNIANRAARDIILSAPFDWRLMLVSGVITLAVLLHGYSYFNRNKWRVVERP